MPVAFSLCVALCLSLCISLSACLSLCMPVCMSIYLSLSLQVSGYLCSVCLSHTDFKYVFAFLYLPLCIAACLCLCLPLSVFPSFSFLFSEVVRPSLICQSACASASLSFSLLVPSSFSLCPPASLSLCQKLARARWIRYLPTFDGPILPQRKGNSALDAVTVLLWSSKR